MLLNKKQRIFLLSAPLLFSACNDDVINDSKDDSQKEPVEVIVPVDFRYLTLNNSGTCGEKPSISYVHKNSTVFPDYFLEVNGYQTPTNPNAAFQLRDKVLLAYGSFWNNTGLTVLDANSFVKKHDVSFDNSIIPYAIEWLGGDSVIVAGRYKNETTNAYIADISGAPLLKRSVDMGFTVYKMKKIGSKLFALGCRDNINEEPFNPKILVADINNIRESGFRTAGEDYHLGSKYAELCVDKNGNLWFAANKGGYKLFCLDTKSEKIIHTVEMPNSMSTYNELAYTISNDGSVIYLRNHKAFYTVNVDAPQKPDEPVFELLKHVGSLNDLKIADNGNLLFVNENMSCNAPSSVIEIDTKGEKWSVLSETKVGMVTKSIYVSKYEKQ